MLTLSRKIDETIIIGKNVMVTVNAIRGDKVKLGITAPPAVKIRRGELSPHHDDTCTQRVRVVRVDGGHYVEVLGGEWTRLPGSFGNPTAASMTATLIEMMLRRARLEEWC